MKGKIFVCVYSVIIIGLFCVCCYLMTIVNPSRLPDTRRYHVVNDVDDKNTLPHDNPDYGLEKIPEGADADEFRKNLATRVTTHDLETDKTPYEDVKRVVPPIWPDNVAVINVYKQNNDSNQRLNKVKAESSLVKGRRSINNKLQNLKENSGSTLLKILDDNGHKKIEIKLIAGNINPKKLRKNSYNQLNANITTTVTTKVNESTEYLKYDDNNDKVIQIKVDDVILVNILDTSDIFLDNSELTDANNTDVMPKLLMNITDYSYSNKTYNNASKLNDIKEVEKKIAEDPMHKDMYTFNLLYNSENITEDPTSNTEIYNVDSLISSTMLRKNGTDLSSKVTPFNTTISEKAMTHVTNETFYL